MLVIMHRSLLLVSVLLGVLLLSPLPARAEESTIKHPGDHPHYSVELEPHVLFAWDNNFYAGSGFGLGGRVTIPVTHEGFIKSINNSVGIGFGLDWVHYGDCYYYYGPVNVGCGADFFEIPIVMQWNFYLSRHWSVFGEPGLYIYHGNFDVGGYCGGVVGPRGVVYYANCPSTTSVEPAFWAGGRYHINDSVSLTMRIGYPTFTFGVSFFP
jgi:hypothetical protein